MAVGNGSMDNYLKHQEVEGVVAEINLATAAAEKANAALASAKTTFSVENTVAPTHSLTVPKITLKRKAPGTDPGGGTTLSTDAEIRKVLSSYSTSQGHQTGSSSVAESGSLSPAAKRRRSGRTSGSTATDGQNDCYCWICHKEGEVICCETCPRVFHLKCIQLENSPTEDWVCPECVLIMTAENMDTR